MTTPPSEILAVLLAFASIFQQHRVFQKALTLFTGTILCVSGFTVCAALRALGLNKEQGFSRFHRLLNRDHWNMYDGSRLLLLLLIKTFCPLTLTFCIDDTIERRRGKKIKTKGLFKDPLGTGNGKTVTCSGLRWVSVMILIQVPFMTRTVALPFMTIECPSESTCIKIGRRHKSPSRIAEQVCFTLRRWFPDYLIVFVADASYTTKGLFKTCQALGIQLITRAKANTRLFEVAPPRTGKRGRPRTKGDRLSSLKELRNDPNLQWAQAQTEGYGGVKKICLTATRECLWDPAEGGGPIHIQLVFVKELGEDTKAPVFCLMTTGPCIPAEQKVGSYVKRWGQEVTNREVREHLGMETQRQWSDLAIARTTPLIFGMYSLVFLIAERLHAKGLISSIQTAWYQKQDPAFGDLLASVRQLIREHQLSQVWQAHPILKNIDGLEELIQILRELGIAA